jgi:hypothetical protein
VPISDPENKQWALDQIRELDPAVVVDIGPGAGTYSDLARTHTTARWSAIEAWAPYIPKYKLWDKYDHVAVSDIRHTDLRTVAPAPDLAIIGDVLEHMPAHEARTVIIRLQAWTEHLLVALPIVHYEQGAVGGNWFETHHHHWQYDEMLDALGPGVVDSVKGDTLGYYLWSQAG